MKLRSAAAALMAAAFAFASSGSAQSPPRAAGTPGVVDRLEIPDRALPPKVPFAVRQLDPGAAQTAVVIDVDGNGALDFVAGDSWYQAPGWTKHRFREIATVSGYVDVFSDFAIDVDLDRRTDLVTFAYFGRNVSWYRNPGAAGGEWARTPFDEGFSTEFAR